MPVFMKWGDTGTSESSTTAHAVTLTLVDSTSLHVDEPAVPGKSAFDVYVDAYTADANAAMVHEPLPVLMVIADGHY